MKNTLNLSPNSSGNAIIIILIVIALLGALTMTITRMSGNTGEVSQEQAQVVASQILRQGRTLANATDSLIAKGCGVSQLSFENSTVSGYINAQSPSNKSCWLFDMAGAGLNFPTSPFTSNSSSVWAISSSLYVPGIGAERETVTDGTPNSCPVSAPNCKDIIAFLPFVDLNTCKALNILSGVTSSFSTAPPAAIYLMPLNWKFSASNSTPTTFNFSLATNNAGAVSSSATPASNLLWAKKSGCIETAAGYRDSAGVAQTGTGIYFFYQVLYEQ